eukprot:8066077-Pyramimonas_sp.AAC.1
MGGPGAAGELEKGRRRGGEGAEKGRRRGGETLGGPGGLLGDLRPWDCLGKPAEALEEHRRS